MTALKQWKCLTDGNDWRLGKLLYRFWKDWNGIDVDPMAHLMSGVMSDRVGMGIEQAGEKKAAWERISYRGREAGEKKRVYAGRERGEGRKEERPGLLRGQTTRLTLCRLCFRT